MTDEADNASCLRQRLTQEVWTQIQIQEFGSEEKCLLNRLQENAKAGSGGVQGNPAGHGDQGEARENPVCPEGVQ